MEVELFSVLLAEFITDISVKEAAILDTIYVFNLTQSAIKCPFLGTVENVNVKSHPFINEENKKFFSSDMSMQNLWASILESWTEGFGIGGGIT